MRYKPKQCSSDDELETAAVAAARAGDIKKLLSQVVDLKPDEMVKVSIENYKVEELVIMSLVIMCYLLKIN